MDFTRAGRSPSFGLILRNPMATEKRHFPTPKEMKRRRLYSDLLTAIIAGGILSGLLAAALWFLAKYRV